MASKYRHRRCLRADVSDVARPHKSADAQTSERPETIVDMSASSIQARRTFTRPKKLSVSLLDQRLRTSRSWVPNRSASTTSRTAFRLGGGSRATASRQMRTATRRSPNGRKSTTRQTLRAASSRGQEEPARAPESLKAIHSTTLELATLVHCGSLAVTVMYAIQNHGCWGGPICLLVRGGASVPSRRDHAQRLLLVRCSSSAASMGFMNPLNSSPWFGPNEIDA